MNTPLAQSNLTVVPVNAAGILARGGNNIIAAGLGDVLLIHHSDGIVDGLVSQVKEERLFVVFVIELRKVLDSLAYVTVGRGIWLWLMACETRCCATRGFCVRVHMFARADIACLSFCQ